MRHTSSTEFGQIYIPEVNWALAVGTVALVLGFGSSDNLAAAYGIAVTGTMTITTLLFHRVARDRWRWSRWVTWPLTFAFLVVDLAFLAANVFKIEEGGWFPLVDRRLRLHPALDLEEGARGDGRSSWRASSLPLELFLPDLEKHPPHRIPGTAVFMTSNPGGTPGVLLHHLKHNKVLHERVLLVSVLTEEVPFVPAAGAPDGEEPGQRHPPGRRTVRLHGDAQRPGPAGRRCPLRHPRAPPRERGDGDHLLPGPGDPHPRRVHSGMARWRKRLFIVLARNSSPASAYFGLPPNRVVEMGAQVQF